MKKDETTNYIQLELLDYLKEINKAQEKQKGSSIEKTKEKQTEKIKRAAGNEKLKMQQLRANETKLTDMEIETLAGFIYYRLDEDSTLKDKILETDSLEDFKNIFYGYKLSGSESILIIKFHGSGFLNLTYTEDTPEPGARYRDLDTYTYIDINDDLIYRNKKTHGVAISWLHFYKIVMEVIEGKKIKGEV